VAHGCGVKVILYKELSYKIMAAVFEVHKVLGPGFLEKVYENALVKEFETRKIAVETQKEINISYKGNPVGNYYSDMLVECKVIIELKAVPAILPIHEAQLLNYLKATGIKLGILVNMGGKKVEFKRMVY